MADVITTTSQSEEMRKLKESMYIGASGFIGEQEADKDEPVPLKEISFAEDELFMFNNVPDCAYSIEEIVSQSKIENFTTTFLKNIFADVINTKLVYRTVQGISRWVLKCDFKFMTDHEFDAIKTEDPDTELKRAVSSSFEPTKERGLAETILALNDNQQISASDVTKYASITKEAKQFLTNFIYFYDNKNKKKRWVRGENYDISYFSQNAFNGVKYNNIIASIYIDAEIALSIFCATKEDKGKYKFALRPLADNLTTMEQNSLFKLRRISKKIRKTRSNEYGIQFQD